MAPDAIRALERYRAEVAIIGASGLASSGVSEAMLQIGQVYAAMLRTAERSLVLADHSKFGKRALMLLSPWTKCLSLMTGRLPEGELQQFMREAGAEIIQPEPVDAAEAES